MSVIIGGSPGSVTNYLGSWNATTNSPTITSSVGPFPAGSYYIVGTAGTTSINGVASWSIGDWVVWSGSVWQKITGGATALTVSSSNITGGTSGRVLYNNAGTLGERATTGTGSAVLSDSPTFTGSPVFPGSGIWNAANVGIGTTSPRPKLELVGANVTQAWTNSSAGADEKTWDLYTAATQVQFRAVNDAYSAGNAAFVINRSGYVISSQIWYANSTEGMRLNSTGLGVGVTPVSSTSKVQTTGDFGFAADGIGPMGNLYYSGGFKYHANGIGWYMKSSGGYFQIYTAPNNAGGAAAAATVTARLLIDPSNGNVFPGGDNTQTLGAGSNRWSVVYAGTGTINTSGRDAKVGIREATDAERRAARRILDAGPKLYRFKDSVDEKGDAARLHAGYIAEDVRDALEAEGLDPWAYGFMCADPLTTVETYTETVSRPKMRTVTTTERAVEIIDGQPTMVTRTVEREEPVGQMVPVVDENGEPVMQPAAQSANDGPEPMTHFVPDLEEVEETRTREVPVLDAEGKPVMRLGLRYSELEAFLKSATP